MTILYHSKQNEQWENNHFWRMSHTKSLRGMKILKGTKFQIFPLFSVLFNHLDVKIWWHNIIIGQKWLWISLKSNVSCAPTALFRWDLIYKYQKLSAVTKICSFANTDCEIQVRLIQRIQYWHFTFLDQINLLLEPQLFVDRSTANQYILIKNIFLQMVVTLILALCLSCQAFTSV